LSPNNSPKADIQSLKGFAVIGVTEKDLGTTLLERARKIAQLRVALDTAGNAAPIHVWGGLDPVTTPIYFFAGAHIFDGVSWLRYAYTGGVAANRESFPVLEEGTTIGDNAQALRHIVSIRNLRALDHLGNCLKRWLDSGGTSFEMFGDRMGERLSRAYDYMRAEVEELREVSNGR
jgi:hypothetical protein